MIHCKSTCPHYADGCHKSCARWRVRQKCLSVQYRRKMDYLRAHDETCRLVIRQCRTQGPARGLY